METHTGNAVEEVVEEKRKKRGKEGEEKEEEERDRGKQGERGQEKRREDSKGEECAFTYVPECFQRDRAVEAFLNRVDARVCGAVLGSSPISVLLKCRERGGRQHRGREK